MTEKAIILAAGLGTRMRRSAATKTLSDQQASVAAEGLKALIPIDRPFLDYSLSSLADAGYREVCLVIGPNHQQVRDYYTSLACERIAIEFAVQSEPLGTAHALTAAADFADGDPVLVLNGDNYYPTPSLRRIRETAGSATIGFQDQDLVANSNIPADRVAAYAVIEQDHDGYLKNIVEKPDPSMYQPSVEGASQPQRLISMNCWRFEAAIFEACRSIDRSSRGEYEMADAVMYSIHEMGERYRVIVSDEGVLDLSHQEDIATVTRWLKEVEVRL